MKLTTSQKRHLRLLCTAEAFERESAASAYTLSTLDPDRSVHAGSLARLERLNLTSSRVKYLGRGHQVTVYWLTDAGVETLRLLSEGCAA